MSQRLVRAKTKIRAAGIPFLVPDRDALAERLGFVLDAIYAAYTTGWETATEGGLAAEAISLARVLARLLPNEPEAMGLLALVLHCESRRAARRDEEGRFVPLPEQDARRWDRAMIHEAEAALATAARFRSAGRFQLEAAIQSAHARRGEGANWEAIALLYEALVRVSPSWGARIGRAVALGRARGAIVGLAALDELPGQALAEHQPYWAARAELLTELARRGEARTAYARAITLSGDEATRDFLRARSARLE
jgi:RNA polymerase sigma-70 factor (ECF subfamily)